MNASPSSAAASEAPLEVPSSAADAGSVIFGTRLYPCAVLAAAAALGAADPALTARAAPWPFAVALVFFGLLLWRVILIGWRSPDLFGLAFAAGIGSMLLFQLLVNVGMVLGIMPITGIPLPFVSFGPSFLLVSWLAVGLLLRLSADGRGQADAIGL